MIRVGPSWRWDHFAPRRLDSSSRRHPDLPVRNTWIARRGIGSGQLREGSISGGIHRNVPHLATSIDRDARTLREVFRQVSTFPDNQRFVRQSRCSVWLVHRRSERVSGSATDLRHVNIDVRLKQLNMTDSKQESSGDSDFGKRRFEPRSENDLINKAGRGEFGPWKIGRGWVGFVWRKRWLGIWGRWVRSGVVEFR